MNRDINFLKNNLIAHRGMHNIENGIPENSINAFKQAIKFNYIIELDLHLLKDDNIVVFHDDNLKRMTGLDRNIKDTTYEELKNLKLKGKDSYIPLFKDVLEIIAGKVPILIEFKYDVKCGLLEKKAMELLKNYSGKFAVQSFNPFSLYWFKKNYPNIIRGQLSYNYSDYDINFIKKFVLKNMLFNFITKPDFISYGINSLPNKTVEKFRKSNLVLGWTIRTHADLLNAKKYCDNFICENFDDVLK